MPKFALALDTTSTFLDLAIAEVQPLQLVKSERHELGRDLSWQIHSYLASFISDYSWDSLAFVAIAAGVGGFTSTRIGIVLARTLCQQLDIPLYAFSCHEIAEKGYAKPPINSLVILAHQVWETGHYPHWSEALPLYSEVTGQI